MKPSSPVVQMVEGEVDAVLSSNVDCVVAAETPPDNVATAAVMKAAIRAFDLFMMVDPFKLIVIRSVCGLTRCCCVACVASVLSME